MGDLRWCVTESLFRADTINFAVTGAINLNARLPNLTSNVSIQGPGANLMTVRRSTGGDYGVFTVVSSVTASVSGLTISNASGYGISGILNSGMLTVSNSTISGNSGSAGISNNGRLTVSNSAIWGNSGGYAGGILNNNGTVTISNSTISGNSGNGISNYLGMLTISNSTISGNAGHGIYNPNGTVTITMSTIAGNSGNGVGVYNPNGTVTISTSTISGNSGGGVNNGGALSVSNSTITGNLGSGIYNGNGMLTVSNSTVAGNSATLTYGGGIYNAGTMTTRNTIIAGNTAPSGPDIYGNMGSQGYNLLGNPVDASGWTGTDLLHVDPLLGPLQNNGGPTQTMTLVGGSPAIDAGDPAQANTPDQRGVWRTGGVNIGAYQASATTLLVAGFPSPINPGMSGPVTVTARDTYGNTAAGYRGTVHFTSSDPQATLPANYTFTGADNGVHTFSVTLRTLGTQSVTVTDTAAASLTGTQAGILVSNLPVMMQVAGFPSPTMAGVAGNTTVAIKDSQGHVITSYRGTVHFSSSDRQAVLPSDYSFTAIDSGVHTFSVTLKTAGTQSITVTDTAMPTLTGMQSGILVNPAAANTLSAAFVPSPITAGANGSLTLTAQDAYGNIASGYRGTVHVSSSDPQATLPPNYAFTSGDNGTHTFSVILKTSGNQTITATDQANAALTASVPVQVTPAAAAVLRVAGFPSPVAAGNPQLLTVTAQDAYGNTAPSYRGTIHFTSSDSQALLAYDYTFTAADNGSHPFAAVPGTVGTQTLTATDTGNAAITGTQAGIVVIPGLPDHLQVVASVSSSVAGTPFDVTVTVQDRFHNTVTGYTGTVAFSSQDPYGATLPPNYTFQPSDQGMATFSGGATLFTAGVWDVTATDTASGITGTANVVVTPAAAVSFAITAPANVPSGTPFDVTLTALDPYGNTDVHYVGTVTWTTTDPDPGVQLPADYTFQASDQGQVTFPGGVVLITPGDQTITATDTADGTISGSATVTVNSAGPGANTRNGRRPASFDPLALDRFFASGKERSDHGTWASLVSLASCIHRGRADYGIDAAVANSWIWA
jgi:hypothetical protein